MDENNVTSNISEEEPNSEPKMSRFDLPGLNLPLNFVPGPEQGGCLFEHPLEMGLLTDRPLITLREITMLQLMDHLTDKPNWQEKIFDDEIAMKWKAEALDSKGTDITQSMAEWCIAELRYKASIFEKLGAVSVFPGDVVKSDVAIPPSLKQALQSAVFPLENIPEIHKDWHPGSEGKVLNLVHPSLFPLIYGRTRVLQDRILTLDDCITSCGDGIVIPTPGLWRTTYSKKFQWLPCDVDISGSNGVKITSYINNLHPQKHAQLYTIIEEIIDRAIPLWNMTLSPESSRSSWYRRIEYEVCQNDEDAVPVDGEGPEQGEWEDNENYEARRLQWAQIVKPEPGIFSLPKQLSETVDLKRDYKHRGLQVIVKLENIHLTPDKPKFEAGIWHVQGQLNEHICASAFYYYDSDNVTTSHLAFRQESSDEEAERKGYKDPEWLNVVYGFRKSDPPLQVLGAVITPEGRLITSPNILQHQVQPFELVDKSKPGHRKILALFLVDPGIRIISTANVPAQRIDWWKDEIYGGRWDRLPVELREQISENVGDWPLGMKEAKELRLELTATMKHFAVMVDEPFRSLRFSLCEH